MSHQTQNTGRHSFPLAAALLLLGAVAVAVRVLPEVDLPAPLGTYLTNRQPCTHLSTPHPLPSLITSLHLLLKAAPLLHPAAEHVHVPL
jgi:hypothetical protein